MKNYLPLVLLIALFFGVTVFVGCYQPAEEQDSPSKVSFENNKPVGINPGFITWVDRYHPSEKEEYLKEAEEELEQEIKKWEETHPDGKDPEEIIYDKKTYYEDDKGEKHYKPKEVNPTFIKWVDMKFDVTKKNEVKARFEKELKEWEEGYKKFGKEEEEFVVYLGAPDNNYEGKVERKVNGEVVEVMTMDEYMKRKEK